MGGELTSLPVLSTTPFLLQEDHFVVYEIGKRHINATLPHACSSFKKVDLLCVDENGIMLNHRLLLMHCYFDLIHAGVEHGILFMTCECEPLVQTLVRAHLWPATPLFPRRVFTFKLLDWAEALLLECQVALKDLCQALYFQCPYPFIKVSAIHNIINYCVYS